MKRTLLEKLNDQEYFKSLSRRSQRELLFCKYLLTEKELQSISSIAVGYKIARERYIEKYIPEDLREEYKKKGRPLFVSPNDLKRCFEEEYSMSYDART